MREPSWVAGVEDSIIREIMGRRPVSEKVVKKEEKLKVRLVEM